MNDLPEHLPLSEQQIDALATYNSEVRRGLKHHDYWHREMARLQRIFDLQHFGKPATPTNDDDLA